MRTLLLYFLVLPMAIDLLLRRHPRWRHGWRFRLFLLHMFIVSGVTAIVGKFLAVSFGLDEFRGPETFGLFVVSWFILPITSIPYLACAWATRKCAFRRHPISHFHGALVMALIVSCLGFILLAWAGVNLMWGVGALGGWLLLNLVVGVCTGLGGLLWRRTVPWTPEGVMPSAVEFTCGAGNDAVLFVHGFNDVPYVWKRMAEEVSARGFMAHVMRLPGAGARNPTTSLVAMQQAVTARIDALAERHRRVFLVGHSMGGALVLDALYRQDAWRERSPVAGACLLAPLVEISRARSPLLSPQAWYRILRVALPSVRTLPSVFRREPSADDDPSFRYSRDGWNAICLYDALFRLIRRVRTLDRTAIGTPFTVFTAGDDRVVDSRASAAWFRDCPACRRVIDVPNARHELQLQACWRMIVDHVVTVFTP